MAHHFYSGFCLLMALTGYVLGVIVYTRSTHPEKVHRLFLWMAASLATWTLGLFLHSILSQTPDEGLFWTRITHVAAILIPVFVLHFVGEWLKLNLSPRVIQAMYGIAGLFEIFNWIPNVFFSGAVTIYGIPFYPLAGPLYVLYLIYFAFGIGYPVLRMYQELGDARGNRREQIRYQMVGVFIASLGGPANFLPSYGIHVFPGGTFFVFFYFLLTSYAILRHRLMDITVIIRKTLVYSLLSALLTVVYFIVVLTFGHFLQGWMQSTTLFSYIAAVLVTLLFHPLRTRVQRFVDKRFFRETLDREKKFLEISHEILEQKTPEKLAESFLSILDEALHPKKAALYLHAPEGRGFKLALPAAAGLDEIMPEENPWVRYFGQYAQPILRNLLGSYAGNPQAELLEATTAEMKRLDLSTVFPLISQGRLLGYLLLGEKKSEEPYRDDDLLLLGSAVDQAALAYERYLLDKGLQEAPQAFKTMTSRFVHEIKTPISNIHLPADILLMYVDALKSGKCSLEEVLPKLETQLAYIRDQSRTAAEKIDAIRQMSKNTQDSYVPLVLAEVVKTSLTSLDQLIQKTGVQLMIQVPSSLPKIKGNSSQLGIVIMNLAKNGIEAMGEGTTTPHSKILRVEARETDESIVLSVEDHGHGISPDNLGRLFQPNFSTKGTEGTGVGLFLAQEVIKAHGGTIEAKTEVGRGTTFIIRLPKLMTSSSL